MGRDHQIRVFNFLTGKLYPPIFFIMLIAFYSQKHRTYNESLQLIAEQQKDDESFYKLEPIDFGRRMAVEREINNALLADTPSTPAPSVLFDESNNFIMYL